MILKSVIFINLVLLAYTVNLYYITIYMCVITVLILIISSYYLTTLKDFDIIDMLLLIINIIFIFSTTYWGFCMIEYLNFHHEYGYDFTLFDMV